MGKLRRTMRIVVAASVAGLLLAAAMPPETIASEETTITAFSAWDGRGNLFETGADEATFVGMLSGTFYVDTEKGPIASGVMVCPASVTVNTKDRSQTGTGRCTVASPEGDRVYADIACEGFFLIGCTGEFTITGGTGRYSGITGGGPMIVRSDFGRMKAVAGDAAEQRATGILYLRDLHYKIP